jgi:hypothetical protein
LSAQKEASTNKMQPSWIWSSKPEPMCGRESTAHTFIATLLFTMIDLSIGSSHMIL